MLQLVHTCYNGTRILTNYDSGYTEIELADGRVVKGYPQDSNSQRETARRLGYGDDQPRMCAEHDPLHALLADWLGLPKSYSMAWAAGDRDERTKELGMLEEAAVMAVQEYMRKARGTMPLGVTY